MYCAIIGDMIHSKKISHRASVQSQLKQTLQTINSDFNSIIASDFTITLGDEFQGLLNSLTLLLQIVQHIQRQLYPVRLRFGIGIGEIHTEVNKDLAIGADGPAYHYARNMIEEMKKHEKEAAEAEIMLKSNENSPFDDDLINASLASITFIEKKWTHKQREKIYAMQTLGGTQHEVAASLGIGQSTLQEGLAASGFYTYRYIMNTVQQTLDASWERTS